METANSNSDDAKGPRVLLAIFSAGVDPWLSIEKKVQEHIVREMEDQFVATLWFQGSPEISSRLRHRFVSWLFRKQINLLYIKPRFIRRPLKILWGRFRWKALGSSYLFRLLEQRRTRPVATNSSNRILQDFPIQLPLAGVRTLDAMHFAIRNYEFDFLLRINSTCVPTPGEIRALVKNLPKERVYGGRTLRLGGTTFVSGAAILLSRDVVDGIVKHSRDFRLNLWEDVGLGQLIQARNLDEIFDIDRRDVTRVDQVPSKRISGWPGAFVVYCKAETPTTTQSEPVIRIMQALRVHLTNA